MLYNIYDLARNILSSSHDTFLIQNNIFFRINVTNNRRFLLTPIHAISIGYLRVTSSYVTLSTIETSYLSTRSYAPRISWDTLKNPSPYSEDQVHLLVLLNLSWLLNTRPCISQTSTQGISSTGKPLIAKHFKWTGCLFGYPPLSTVLSTFSKRIR